MRRVSVFGCLLLTLAVLLVAPPTYAATFTVTRTDDPPPGSCLPGDCSLREAIIAANTSAGPDTINLPADVYTLSIANSSSVGENAAAQGDLDILSNITLVGAGADRTTIRAGVFPSSGIDRVFHVLEGATLNLSGVTIRNGRTGVGGGISSNGTLIVTRSAITDNTATTSIGGGIDSRDVGSGASLTLIDSVVSNNTGVTDGGGIWSSGNLTIVNSTISGNASGEEGGGLYRLGSAIPTIIRSSTIVRNVADSDRNGSGTGGGIYLNFGTTLQLGHTIIAGNYKGTVATRNDCLNGGGAIESEGYNLIETTTSCSITGATSTNITGQNPILGPLQNNGGPTPTHALLAGSPAINAGAFGCPDATGGTLATDQRGVLRPQNRRCDIGAFELEQATEPLLVFLPIIVK
jgi:CSLREA domain-containing protein